MRVVLSAIHEEIDTFVNTTLVNKWPMTDENKFDYDITSGFHTQTSEAIRVAATGMGKVNAAYFAARMIQPHHTVKAVINIGLAGALDSTLHQGDIIVCTHTVQHDYDARPLKTQYEVDRINTRAIKSSDWLLNAANEIIYPLIQEGSQIHQGICLTGDQFIDSRQGADFLFNAFQGRALCVDMEAAAIAQVCAILGRPFISIKIISDSPNPNSGEEFTEYLSKCGQTIEKILTPLLAAAPPKRPRLPITLK